MRTRQVSSQNFHPKTNNEQHVAPPPAGSHYKKKLMICRKNLVHPESQNMFH
jgi:hypothetical protein